jgi:hypothetical protein
MQRLNRKSSLQLDKYVNVETGEQLIREYPTISSINYYDQDLIMIDSKEYAIIDSYALDAIAPKFSSTELGKILLMSRMIKGKFNALHTTKGKAHTKDSLMTALDYKKSSFAEFIKKLLQENIIQYVYDDLQENISLIMFNPYIARKSKTLERTCVACFKDPSKAPNEKNKSTSTDTTSLINSFENDK